MKSVCAKHEQAYEEFCPYCEKKAEGPSVAPAAPPAATSASMAAAQMNATAGNMMGSGWWVFTPHDYDAVTYLCRRCGHYFHTIGQPSCPVQP